MDSSEVQSEIKSKTVNVKFSGKGSEFFGIVIVNILLSAITLGIYSAWATVRTKSYFYSNTSIDNHVFSYLAKPMQILIGRVLAIIFFVAFVLLSQFNPIIGVVLSLGLIFLSPWLINSSLRFDYRMTSYRNVCFNFDGTYGKAFITFVLLPLAAIFSLYLALPWVLKKMDEYLLSNVSYGDRKLEVQLETKEYYKTSLWVLLATFIFFSIFAALPLFITGAFSFIQDPLDIFTFLASMTLFLPFFFLGLFLLFNVIGAIYAVKIRNHILRHAEFDNIARFDSTMRILPLALLLFTNTLAIIFSLGLAYPWTQIRIARFSADNTQVQISEEADNVFAVKADEQSSLGGEISSAFDLGMSVG